VVADVADVVGGPHVTLVGKGKPADVRFRTKDMVRRLPVRASRDPHVWLSPPLLEGLVGQVVERLSQRDKRHAADFVRNADAYVSQLVALDARFGEQLADCETRTVVTNRDSYSWLMARYGLTQEVIPDGPVVLDAIDLPGHSYLAAMDANLELLRVALACRQ
jgi:ABC-type Zn uptake system ZnuABC Zn-binding protein ZnuA